MENDKRYGLTHNFVFQMIELSRQFLEPVRLAHSVPSKVMVDCGSNRIPTIDVNWIYPKLVEILRTRGESKVGSRS